MKKLSAVALTRIARLAITVKIRRRKMDFVNFGIGDGGEFGFGFEPELGWDSIVSLLLVLVLLLSSSV